MIEAYPLSWPAGWRRTSHAHRRRARFNRKAAASDTTWQRSRPVTVTEAVSRAMASLQRFGVDRGDIIISTNIPTRNDGLPYGRAREPDDPGAAVYWRDADLGDQCMAVDLYDRLADNLAAIAATIEALRAIERHGGAQILRRAFQGFKALPATTDATMTTEQAAQRIGFHSGVRAERILGDASEAKRAVRLAVSKAHPDAGGSQSAFILIQDAKRVLALHHAATTGG